jgi:hypothetical protein
MASNPVMMDRTQPTVCQLITVANPCDHKEKMVNYVALRAAFFSHRERKACLEGNKEEQQPQVLGNCQTEGLLKAV